MRRRLLLVLAAALALGFGVAVALVATRTLPTGTLETEVTDVTVVLIAHDGEWTRRRVPGVAAARQWGNRMGIPVYDVALTGYPQRKRDYDERRKKADQA